MESECRKPTRLKGYDYNEAGYYFVTICTQDRRYLLSEIIVGQGLAPAECRLTRYGEAAKEELYNLEKRFVGVNIDKSVIMPNHIHAIVKLKPECSVTLSDAICAYKSLITRKCRQIGFVGKLFQSSFYDHVIRNEKDYSAIWEYIDNNPTRWNEDRFWKNNK